MEQEALFVVCRACARPFATGLTRHDVEAGYLPVACLRRGCPFCGASDRYYAFELRPPDAGILGSLLRPIAASALRSQAAFAANLTAAPIRLGRGRRI